MSFVSGIFGRFVKRIFSLYSRCVGKYSRIRKTLINLFSSNETKSLLKRWCPTRIVSRGCASSAQRLLHLKNFALVIDLSYVQYLAVALCDSEFTIPVYFSFAQLYFTVQKQVSYQISVTALSTSTSSVITLDSYLQYVTPAYAQHCTSTLQMSCTDLHWSDITHAFCINQQWGQYRVLFMQLWQLAYSKRKRVFAVNGHYRSSIFEPLEHPGRQVRQHPDGVNRIGGRRRLCLRTLFWSCREAC